MINLYGFKMEISQMSRLPSVYSTLLLASCSPPKKQWTLVVGTSLGVGSLFFEGTLIYSDGDSSRPAGRSVPARRVINEMLGGQKAPNYRVSSPPPLLLRGGLAGT